ncbi:hypothetical protein STENM36S_05881 [Streptomyces tendae]
MNGDAGLEAHAFCNMAFLARDAGACRARRSGRPRPRSAPPARWARPG